MAATHAIVAIQQLKARYAEHADAKYGVDRRRAAPAALADAARAQAACFTEDARWEAGMRYGGDIVGRPALEAFFADPPWCFASHYYVSPMIAVDGDAAQASWRLWQYGVQAEGDEPVLLSARTEETYRLTEAGWLHDRVRFTRIDVLKGVTGLEAVL